MNCKYKLSSNERFCTMLHGECQFVDSGYGTDCPIYQGYPDWDKYVDPVGPLSSEQPPEQQ